MNLRRSKGFFFILSFLMLLASILLAFILSCSVNFKLDEIGGLVNIYLPFLIGTITSFIFLSATLLIRKKITLKTTLLICICINVATGLYLRESFQPFPNELSDENVKLISKSPFKFVSATNSVIDTGKVIIQNLDNIPSDNHLVFSVIHYQDQKKPGAGITSINHDRVVIRIKNQKSTSLTITKSSFSNSGFWSIVSVNNVVAGKNTFPIIILPDNYADVAIDFKEDLIGNRIKPFWWKALFVVQKKLVTMGRSFDYQLPFGTTCFNLNGTLNLYTSDVNEPVKVVYLHTLWQYRIEGDWEPDMQRVLNTMYFKTRVGFKNFDNGLNGQKIVPLSDEVAGAYFEAADTSAPVKITKLASYHGCGSAESADTVSFYYQHQKLLHPLLSADIKSGQMLLPPDMGNSKSYISFKPALPFALKVGTSDTDRKRNFHGKIGVRIWNAIDENGDQIKNTYILGSDHLGAKGTNYDYQDNVYYLENVRVN